VMKFKPKKKDIYDIVSYQEEVDKYGQAKGTLGAFICRGEDSTLFGVGTGFTAHQRKDLWQRRESLVGRYLEVEYQALTPKKVPRFPVFCKVLEPLV
jgi:DNA ligase 1